MTIFQKTVLSNKWYSIQCDLKSEWLESTFASFIRWTIIIPFQQIIVSTLNKDTVPDDFCVKIGHFIMRLGINIIIIIMMLSTGLIVYYLLESKSLKVGYFHQFRKLSFPSSLVWKRKMLSISSLKAEIPVFGEMIIALTVTIIILLFPLVCSTMVEWEEYKSRQTALYLTLIRCVPFFLSRHCFPITCLSVLFHIYCCRSTGECSVLGTSLNINLKTGWVSWEGRADLQFHSHLCSCLVN